jgi:2-dehydro-3-deoxygluconokinase
MHDLVSLGEVMLRMSPPRYQRLRRMRTLDVEVAGAQLNIAANMARFGKKAAFVSKLPKNELGVLAYDTCTSYGVDMQYVQMVDGARMGVNYLEFTATPRAPVTIFDRKGSAASTITAQDFDWAAILAGVKIAHTDGIFPGLSTGCREATTAYLLTAKEAGAATSFDMNYREHLWTPQTARECWDTLLPSIDILVTNRSVSEIVFGFSGTDEDLLRQYHAGYGCKLVCLTSREIDGIMRGAWSSVALHEGAVVQGRRYEFDAIDRYGTGDAFFAGLLYGYLEGDVQFALNFGNAACALAHTIEGDIAQFSAAEVLPLLAETIDLRVRR